jgi:streptogramin lyase
MNALSQAKAMKYFAFLSYSHDDAAAAAALSRFIETFRVPVRLGGKEQKLPKRMFPVFRDRDEFSSSADLGAAIEDALAKSGALIVLCSPSAAQSKWVDEEIRTFRRVGDPKRIFAVLLKGDAGESLPPTLKGAEVAPIVADLRRGKSHVCDARLRLVAALLGLGFDALKRHERQRTWSGRVRSAALALVAAAVIGGTVVGYNADQVHFIENIQATGLAGADGAYGYASTGSDGSLWIAYWVSGGSRAQMLEHVLPGGGAVEYRMGSGDELGSIAVAHDGIWFSTSSGIMDDEIDRFIPASGTLKRWILGAASRPNPALLSVSGPVLMPASGGGLWFTFEDGFCGRIAPDGAIVERTSPCGGTLVTTPDGSLWFSGAGQCEVGRILPRGRVTLYPIKGFAHSESACAIPSMLVGPDGALWLLGAKRIAGYLLRLEEVIRITPTGRIMQLRIPVQVNVDASASAAPTVQLVAGPNRTLWFADGNRIGRIELDGRIAEYSVPDAALAHDLVAGPDGALWFLMGRVAHGVNGPAMQSDPIVYRMTQEGALSEYRLPSGDGVDDIFPGPGHTLWYIADPGVIGSILTGHWFFGE